MISKNQIKYVRQLEQKKFRKQEGLFIAEGHKVVGDLLRAGYIPKMLFATEKWLHENRLLMLTTAVTPTTVSDDELRRLSLQQHPQQVLALFPIPSSPTVISSEVERSLHSSLALALDGVQDPGNLGTIIRIADWFGISTIICSDDTVDAWNPKVVQATMGSLARVNIIYTNLPEFLDTLPPDYPVYGTLLDGDNIYTQPLTTRGLIVMGNEGNGISDAVRARINRRLLIPAFRQGDTADSLNVAIATAITCSEFRRRSNV
jgi:TrmH family RNA methyltransferase